jgi:SDR family mycofactocin-dependent oxidoreductase
LTAAPDAKVVLVTGAARGQGRAHAVKWAQAGADVVALDVDEQLGSVPYPLASASDLAQTARLVEDLGGRIVTVRADVRSQADLDDAVAEGLSAFGHIDVCIANAGIWSIGSFWELDETQWGEMIDVNLSGVWRTAKAVPPHMIERRSGCIIITASVNALEGGKRSAHYATSKHGLIGLMRTVALELAPYGIRCNAICPGAVATDMVTWPGAFDLYAGHAGGTWEDYEDATYRYHALAGVGPMEPEVIAEAALWLASDRSAYITGVALPVDAGHLLLPGVNHSAARRSEAPQPR